MKKRILRNKIINIRNIRRFIGILVLVLFFIFCSKIDYVDAGENDSTLVKNRVDDIFASVILNGQSRLFYLNMYEMNGRVAYCIELGVDITTNIYNSTNDFYRTALTNGQNNYIRTVSYYGYGYSGHSDYRYYMAAQELIWEYLSGVEVEWVQGTVNSNTKINIDSYKNKIRSLFSDYNKTPAIYWNNGGEVRLGQELVLKDYASVLGDFEVVSSGHSNVSINGNDLIIKFSDNYLGKEEITLRKKLFYNYKGTYYYYGNSQKLISSGNIGDVLAKYTFNIKGNSFNGLVVDKDTLKNEPLGEATLEGAVYEVTNENGNLVGTYETDSKGGFVVDDLLYGKYYIKQIEASKGYVKNPEIIEVILNEDGKEVILEQKVISNDIEILKVYNDENGKCFPEIGISFLIYDSSGNVYDEVNTDKEGKIKLWLPYGKYIVHQNTSNYGYDRVDDFEIIVSLEKEDIVRYDLVNNLIKTKLNVVTKNNKNGEIFLLKDFAYKIKKKGSNSYLKVDGNDTFKTDSNGNLIFSMLFSYGDYVLEQVNVPKGIVLNKGQLEFSISDKSNFLVDNGILLLEVEYFNEVMLGNVNVSANKEVFFTTDNKYGYVLENRQDVLFSLIANDDIIVNNKIIYSAGDEVASVTTNEDGQAFIYGIYLGSYCLIDSSNNEKQCFILENTSIEQVTVDKDLEFTIFLEKSDLVIKNLSNNGDVIPDSIFLIVDKEGTLIYRGITNNEGIIKVKDLLHGKYCFYQESASNLYQINKTKKCFLLDKDMNIDFYNDKRHNKKVLVPNTFSDKDNLLGVGFIILIFISIGVLFYRKFI